MVLGLIGLFLLLSALLTAAEAAAFQIGSSRLRTLQEEGFAGAEALTEVRRHAALVGSSVRLATGVLNLTALGAGIVTGAWTLGNGSPWVNLVVGVRVRARWRRYRPAPDRGSPSGTVGAVLGGGPPGPDPRDSIRRGARVSP